MNWQYAYDLRTPEKALQRRLDDRGKDGWELTHVAPDTAHVLSSGGKMKVYHLFWKKRIR